MGYRFLDDYDPRKEQKKKQQQKGTQKAPPSGNPLNPAAQNNKNNKTNTPAATQPRTSKGTALGGSSVTPVQLPVQQITVPKLTKSATPMQTQTPQALTLKLPNIQAFGAGDYSKAGKAMDRIAKTVQAARTDRQRLCGNRRTVPTDNRAAEHGAVLRLWRSGPRRAGKP